MENQLTNNANALRLFFTDEVFVVEDKTVKIPHLVKTEAVLHEETLPAKSQIEPETSTNVIPNLQISAQEMTNVALQVPETLQDKDEVAAIVDFKFLGGNQKSVLILVNDQDHPVSTEQGRELLRKIVKAVDLGTPDFALVNYAHYKGTDFIALQQYFKPVIMLSFGVEIAHLKLDFVWQNEIIVHSNTRIIFAPNLHQLDSDIVAKKLLWGNLQKIK